MAGIGNPQLELSRSRTVALAPACAALAIGTSLALAPVRVGSVTPSPSENVKQALRAIDDGKDQDAAVLLEQAALDGDERAQYLLGALYFTSKSLPANKPLGYAWLELAVDETGSYDELSSRQAVEMMVKAEPLMSGRYLVEADRMAAALRERVATQRAISFRHALDLYTREPARLVGSQFEFPEPELQIRVVTSPSRNPLARLGCASSHGSHCPDASASGPAARCTGLIRASDDRSPGRIAELVKTVNPVRPLVTLLPDGPDVKKQDPPIFVVHMDANGWVCSAVLAVSSGYSDVDEEAIDALRSWQSQSATNNGSPVESLYLVRIATF